MGQNSVMVFEESMSGDHRRVAEATEMGTIAHFFCKNNVHDFSRLVLVVFTNLVFVEIEVFGAL